MGIFSDAKERVFPKGIILRPRNSNWLDLTPSNWETLTIAQLNRELHGAERDETRKRRCTNCGTICAHDEFPPRRNVCKDCFKEQLRENTRKWREHTAGTDCRVVDGSHFHLGRPADSAKVWGYWSALFYRRLEKRPALAASRLLARLRAAISVDSEAPEASDEVDD